jgi:hypothetical protein
VADLVWHAFFYVAAVWGCAFVATLFAFLAVSVDDLRDVVVAALASSACAMWLAPALLLLATRAPWPMIAGLLLVANTVRLLVAARAPRRRTRARPPKPVALRLFRTEVETGLVSRDCLLAMLGAVALQSALWLLYGGYPLGSAMLCAAATWLWTRTSMAKGAYQGRAPVTLPAAMARAAPVVLLAILLSIVGLRAGATGDEGSPDGGAFDTARRVVARLGGPPKPMPPPARDAPVQVIDPGSEPASRRDGIPGLILRAELKSRRQKVVVPFAVPTAKISLARPQTIPFTGEYRFFRYSSGQPPPGSVERLGSPLDAVYATTNGSPLIMEAVQPFDPPVDFARCGRIQISVTNREPLPGTVFLRLEEGAKIEEIGVDFIGVGHAREEVVEFLVPDAPRRPLVSALRLIFKKNLDQESRSTRAAIRWIALIPRTL